MSDSSTTIITAGMHRSGTSLTASLLESAGVNIGHRLMPGAYGNPKGHYENLDFVEFHQTVLAFNNLSEEGWTTKQNISISHDLNERAKTEIRRNNSFRYWGWKDPRTTLFLNFWKTLIPDALFIFVYRSPWDVIDSLFRRGDPYFQQNPTNAPLIWQHYNQEILNFSRLFPSNCILARIDQIIANPNALIQAINTQFNLKLIEPDASLIERDLIKFIPLSNYREALILDFFPDVKELFNQLNQQVDRTLPSIQALDNFSSPKSLASSCEGSFKDWMTSSYQLRELREAQTKVNMLEQHIISLGEIQTQTNIELHSIRTELYHAQEKQYKAQDALNQTQSQLYTLNEGLYKIKAELHTANTDLYKSKTELHTAHVDLHKTREELHKLLQDLHDIKAKLHLSESSLYQAQDEKNKANISLYETKQELYSSQVSLHDANDSLYKSQNELHSTRSLLYLTQLRETELSQQVTELSQQVAELNKQLEATSTLINAMESSKFWKLRNVWFKYKAMLGNKV